MALPVFPFARSVRPKAAEFPRFNTRKATLGGGYTERSAAWGDDFLLAVVFSLEFPQRSTSKTLADFLAFVESVRGAADPWLLSFDTQRYRELRGVEIGTGDASETDFPSSHRYIDATSVVVYVDDVEVNPTDYTLVDNENVPLVRFDVAPGVGEVVTWDADFLVPMHFDADALEPVLRAAFATDATKSVRIDGIIAEEAQPGARLVTTTT